VPTILAGTTPTTSLMLGAATSASRFGHNATDATTATALAGVSRLSRLSRQSPAKSQLGVGVKKRRVRYSGSMTPRLTKR
jgi:hypothetical protein